MQRLFPVRKDAPDTRDHIAAPAAGTLPTFISLGQWLGPVKDQGNLGSCTAHAGTELREWLYRRFFRYEYDKSVPVDSFRLSPLFQYVMERKLEGDVLEDNGAQSRTIFQSLAANGCALETDCPYVEANFKQLPLADIALKAAAYRHISYHRAMTLDILRSVLASGYVATIGTTVFSSFQSDYTATTGNVIVPKFTDTPVGGHEMLVFGYDDVKRVLMVRNSWGEEWGMQGNCFIPYDYFAAMGIMDDTDFWTAHLGKPW